MGLVEYNTRRTRGAGLYR